MDRLSSAEAVYEHVVRYVSDNAWYAYRFDITGYCLYHDIPIPDFSIDSDGFMINKESGKRLHSKYLFRR